MKSTAYGEGFKGAFARQTGLVTLRKTPMRIAGFARRRKEPLRRKAQQPWAYLKSST
jgi:hypothetical protein